AIAEDLGAVLEACVPSGQRALVAGHSMGGVTIASFAAQHPERVEQRIAAIAMVNSGVSELEQHVTIFGDRVSPRVHRAILLPLLTRPLAVPRRIDPVGLRLA